MSDKKNYDSNVDGPRGGGRLSEIEKKNTFYSYYIVYTAFPNLTL